MENEINFIPQTLQQVFVDFLTFLPGLITSLVIFFIGLYLAGTISRTVSRAMRIRDADPEITLLVATIARWSIIVMGTTTALSQVGFDLTAFLTGLGIIGFTIGFAIQDVSKNFIAGLLLLLQQPFDIGNAIEVAGYSGTVLKVDLRATELRTFDGRLVQIPNADVFTNAIVNYSRADRRRVELLIHVAYGTDLNQARRVALDAINSLDGVLETPAPRVVYHTFGGSSIDMTLYYWINTDQTDMFDAQDTGVVAINQAFKQAVIKIPMPAQDVYLHQR